VLLKMASELLHGETLAGTARKSGEGLSDRLMRVREREADAFLPNVHRQ
jgi:hypothetical protein